MEPRAALIRARYHPHGACRRYVCDHRLAPAYVLHISSLYLKYYAQIHYLLSIMSGMALAPWDVLARGKFRTESEARIQIAAGDKGRAAFGSEKLEASEEEKKVSAALEKVAVDVGAGSIQAGM